jgi:nucleotide-binding universal stress UspA family protein
MRDACGTWSGPRYGPSFERSRAMKKILVAYDGGEPAHKALMTAAEMARTFGATLSVISVIPVHPGRAPVDPWDDASVHARELLDAKKLLRDQGLEAELLEPAGDPARTIERIADEGGFDTIVLGSRGLRTVERMLQGSVSEHVATHAQATVVIAR